MFSIDRWKLLTIFVFVLNMVVGCKLAPATYYKSELLIDSSFTGVVIDYRGKGRSWDMTRIQKNDSTEMSFRIPTWVLADHPKHINGRCYGYDSESHMNICYQYDLFKKISKGTSVFKEEGSSYIFFGSVAVGIMPAPCHPNCKIPF